MSFNIDIGYFNFTMQYFYYIYDFVAGIGLVRPPTLSKVPLDLFKTYNAVQQLGGFLNVSWII